MLDPVRLVEALAEERAGLPQDRLREDPEGRPAEPPPAAASEPGTSDASAATLFTHAA